MLVERQNQRQNAAFHLSQATVCGVHAFGCPNAGFYANACGCEYCGVQTFVCVQGFCVQIAGVGMFCERFGI